MMIDFKAEADALRNELVGRRRDFHQHPELAFEEVRTAGIVADELRSLGLETQTGIGKTGVVGILEGAADGPTVLVRADMDALPIHEENDNEYVSTVPGKMHACGHDGHTAIALGVAKLLNNHRDRLQGRVKFVFQPAEEKVSGAQAMIADGVLDAPRPDVTLGLHIWNGLPLGQLGVADGPVLTGGSIFKLTITGHGGHAAFPHETADPVLCAAQLIVALQSVVSRNVDPLDTAVLTVTQMIAGNATNIIPGQVELSGTFRVFRTEVADLVEQRIREISEGLCSAMGCKVEFWFNRGTIPTVNDREVATRVRRAFLDLVNEDQFDMTVRTTASEDVALFMDDVPGMYFFLGAGKADPSLNYGHHHPRFDFDEDALPLGVALLSRAVADYVMAE